MKKKIFGFLLAICLIIPALFATTGCNENPPDTNIYVSTQAELQQAVTQAQSNSKIVLTQDIEINRQITVKQKITIDLNGKEIFNTQDIWNPAPDVKEWALISVQNGGDLTITGNGILNTKEGDCHAVDVRENAKVTIKNGTMIGNVSAVYLIENAIAIIEGGTYDIKQLSSANDHHLLLNIYDNDNATIVVKGGSFKFYDPAHSNSEPTEMNFLPEGYQSVADGDYFVVSKVTE